MRALLLIVCAIGLGAFAGYGAVGAVQVWAAVASVGSLLLASA